MLNMLIVILILGKRCGGGTQNKKGLKDQGLKLENLGMKQE